MIDHVMDRGALLRALPHRRILIVGDLMLDEYLWGDVSRISPEAPVPVIEVRNDTRAAGGAGNVAANVTSLGGAALIAGVVGADPAAAQLRTIFQQQRIHAGGLIEQPERCTTTKSRLIARGQQIVRIDHENRQPLDARAQDALLAWIDRWLPEAEACVLSDYGKGVINQTVAQHLLRAAQKAGRPVVVDPKGTDYAKYRLATVVKPNVHEVERVLREEIEDEAGLVAAGDKLLATLPGSALLVTRGAAGMTLFRDRAAPLHIRSAARHVFDITGAGDTVVATLAMALASGAVLDEAVYLANVAAGIVVGKRGTGTTSCEELEQELAQAASA